MRIVIEKNQLSEILFFAIIKNVIRYMYMLYMIELIITLFTWKR